MLLTCLSVLYLHYNAALSKACYAKTSIHRIYSGIQIIYFIKQVKQKPHTQSKPRNSFTTPHGRAGFSHLQETWAPSTQWWLGETNTITLNDPLPSWLPRFYCWARSPNGVGCPSGHLDCVSAVSPHNFFCSRGLLTEWCKRQRRSWHCELSSATKQLKQPCVINSDFNTIQNHSN